MDRFARIAEVLEVPGSFFLSADGKATSHRVSRAALF
jgi:hypothetical protein